MIEGRGWDLPGTALVWILPLAAPWLVMFDLDAAAGPPVYRILAIGSASIGAILGLGAWAAYQTRHEGRGRRRRVMLWGFPIATGTLAIATAWTAEDARFAEVSLTPFLVWLLWTFLVPLWRDDEALVDSREPDAGWKRLWGARMLYSDGTNAAVWVRMRDPIPFSTAMGYTPNFGHVWGRLAVGGGLLLLIGGLAVSIAAWTTHPPTAAAAADRLSFRPAA